MGNHQQTKPSSVYRRGWQRDWYSFIEPYLDEAMTQVYSDLVESLGPAEHPDFPSWSSSWVGPESPFSREELNRLEVAEVTNLLRSWRPEDESTWHFGPSIEGLGRALTEDVKERASAYSASASTFMNLDPTYVRSIFSGLESAVRDGGSIDWDQSLSLAEYVVSQPFEPDEEVPDLDRDPGWRCAAARSRPLCERDSQIAPTESRLCSANAHGP
jgi:hypothetical protein